VHGNRQSYVAAIQYTSEQGLPAVVPLLLVLQLLAPLLLLPLPPWEWGHLRAYGTE